MVFYVYAHLNTVLTVRGVNLRAFLPNEVAAEREIKRCAAVRGQAS